MAKFNVSGHGLRGCGHAYVLADCCLSTDMPADLNTPWPVGGHGYCRCGAVSEHLVPWRSRIAWHKDHKRAVLAQQATDAWRDRCAAEDMIVKSGELTP